MLIKKTDLKKIKVKVKEKAPEIRKENDITELVFILDRSGSMAGLEDDTIGGFNSMIEKQKKENGSCFVTTVLFDHEISVLHDRADLSGVAPITREDYSVRGCTALIDAVGTTVRRIENIHRYLRPEDVPSAVMFVITTDGLENASKEYSADKVREMINAAKERGWEFLFIGANIDAVTTAGSIGIAEDRAVNYHADRKGTGVLYESVCGAVSAIRGKRGVDKSWAKCIQEDFESRK